MAAAGYRGRRCRPHTLRHSFATHLLTTAPASVSAGAARPREPVHDADLHPRPARATSSRCIRRPTRGREDESHREHRTAVARLRTSVSWRGEPGRGRPCAWPSAWRFCVRRAPLARSRRSSLAGVETVRVDVVVTDAKGRPVSGLRREDFVVREDGAPQADRGLRGRSAMRRSREPKPGGTGRGRRRPKPPAARASRCRPRS